MIKPEKSLKNRKNLPPRETDGSPWQSLQGVLPIISTTEGFWLTFLGHACLKL